MTRRRRVHGVMILPWSIPVASECLNQTFETEIGGEAVKITLPALDALGALTAPEMEAPRLRKNLERTLFKGWGFPLYMDGTTAYGICGARVSFMLTTGVPAVDSPEFRTLRRSFGKWFEIFRYWVCGWSGSLPDDLPNKDNPDIRIYIPNGRTRTWGTGITVGAYVNFDQKPTSAVQLGSAFRHAGRGQHIPVESRLMMDALQALIINDYRRSVIDSATAVEVAMASAVSEILGEKGVPGDSVSKIVVKANGTVGLYDLLATLGVSLPVSKAQLADKLARLRNRAAHQAYEPTGDEARKAHACARKIVDALCPFPEAKVQQ